VRTALLLLVVLGCGPSNHKKGPPVDSGSGSQSGADAAHVISYIAVTPTNPIIELDLNTQASQGFTATAVYADSTTEDVSASVTWTVANPAVGAMTNAVLNIPGFSTSQAAVSLITADYNGMSGQAQITVVAYRKTGTQQDFFFILPYQDPAGNMNKPLEFSTAVPQLDVFFLMDTTGSMSPEITNLTSALNSTVIPGIQAAVANTQLGVGAFDDFPLDGYGSPACSSGDGTADQPFKLRQAITSTTSLVTTAVSNLKTASGGTIGCGSDTPEAGLEAIYQAATGNGLSGPSPTNVPVNHNGVGGVGFRTGTMPVIVDISDADSHGKNETGACGGQAEAYDATVSAFAHTRQDTKDALTNICARLVGMAAQTTGSSPGCIGQAYMEDLATSTGARVPPEAWDYTGTRPAGCNAGQCCTGFGGVGRAPDGQGLCPVVFQVNTDGTGVSASIVTGIQMLTRFAKFDVQSATGGVTTDVDGVPLMAPHTTADFVKSVVPATYQLPPPPPNVPAPTLGVNGFSGVTPGTILGFTVTAFNDFVMQTSQPQIFRATISVLAGSCLPLDQRDVLILVPPMPIQVQ
jgi:hypothetical protein